MRLELVDWSKGVTSVSGRVTETRSRGIPQHLAHHLSQGRLHSLADVHASGQQRRRTVGVEPQAGGGVGRSHGGLDHDRHTLAAHQRLCRPGRLLRSAPPLHRLGRRPETVFQAHRLQGVAGDEDVAVVHQVPEPHLQRVQPEPPRHVVHLRLVGPAHLGHAEAPVRSGGRRIGVDAVRGQALVRDAVGSAGDLTAVARGGGTGQGVGAGIVDRFHLPGQDGAVALHAGLDAHHRRVTVAGEEHFLARKLPLDRPARLPRQRRGQGLEPQVHLAAVAAADVGHHHPHHGLRQLEQLGELDPDGRGVLRGRMDRELACRVPGGGDHVGLQVAVLDLGGGVGVLEDQVRGRETLVDVAAPDAVGGEHVAPVLVAVMPLVETALGLHAGLVEHRRAGRHGLDRVQHRFQRLVFHLDEVQGFLGDVRLFGGHRGHHLAGVAHPVHRHDGLVLDHGSEMGVLRREVRAGEHRRHARKCFRRARVHGDQPGRADGRSAAP